MLIINADDWGRSMPETDAALRCYNRGRITSVSAMVFMEDSERAAGLAIGSGLDVGLHINFTEAFTASYVPRSLRRSHDRLRRFLRANKYALVIYNPFLRSAFREVFVAQGGDGRDHHNAGFSIWLCGGGIKSGLIYGATDELGYSAVENPMDVHDLHATMLKLLGIEHTRLTVKFQGLDARLTNVSGKVVEGILA